MLNKLKILCLKSPSRSLLDDGKDFGMQIDFCEVIHIEPCLDGQRILDRMCSKDVFVFTSYNAVQLLRPYFKKENRAVYCVGEKGANALKTYFDDVKVSSNVKALAEMIITDKVQSLVHFKGNLSLSTLRNALNENEIPLEEELIYNTVETHPVVDNLNYYDALLFFSPSGVRSFTKNNRFPNTIIGAIGETTRKAIDLNDVLVPKNSDTYDLLKGIRTKYESLAQL